MIGLGAARRAFLYTLGGREAKGSLLLPAFHGVCSNELLSCFEDRATQRVLLRDAGVCISFAIMSPGFWQGVMRAHHACNSCVFSRLAHVILNPFAQIIYPGKLEGVPLRVFLCFLSQERSPGIDPRWAIAYRSLVCVFWLFV